MNALQVYKMLESHRLISKEGHIVCPPEFAYLDLRFSGCSCCIPSKENGDMAPSEIRERYANQVELIDREIIDWSDNKFINNIGFECKTTRWVVPIDLLEYFVLASFRSTEAIPIEQIQFL